MEDVKLNSDANAAGFCGNCSVFSGPISGKSVQYIVQNVQQEGASYPQSLLDVGLFPPQ